MRKCKMHVKPVAGRLEPRKASQSRDCGCDVYTDPKGLWPQRSSSLVSGGCWRVALSTGHRGAFTIRSEYSPTPCRSKRSPGAVQFSTSWGDGEKDHGNLCDRQVQCGSPRNDVLAKTRLRGAQQRLLLGKRLCAWLPSNSVRSAEPGEAGSGADRPVQEGPLESFCSSFLMSQLRTLTPREEKGPSPFSWESGICSLPLKPVLVRVPQEADPDRIRRAGETWCERNLRRMPGKSRKGQAERSDPEAGLTPVSGEGKEGRDRQSLRMCSS